jgi:hypothetical protein
MEPTLYNEAWGWTFIALLFQTCWWLHAVIPAAGGPRQAYACDSISGKVRASVAALLGRLPFGSLSPPPPQKKKKKKKPPPPTPPFGPILSRMACIPSRTYTTHVHHAKVLTYHTNALRVMGATLAIAIALVRYEVVGASDLATHYWPAARAAFFFGVAASVILYNRGSEVLAAGHGLCFSTRMLYSRMPLVHNPARLKPVCVRSNTMPLGCPPDSYRDVPTQN